MIELAQSTMLEAVLPLKISGGYQDYDLQRAQILVDSLERFWVGQARLRLTILASQSEMKLIADTLISTRNVDLIVRCEEELLPGVTSSATPGWYKQQALKLAFHKFCAAPFFLTLDADLICAKPFSNLSLIVGGKALTDWEPRATHPDWWRESAEILRLPHDANAPGFAVTPEVLSCELCMMIEERVSRLYQTDCWDHLLSNVGWTEYALYATFALNEGYLDRYHHRGAWMSEHKLALRSWGTFWGKDNFETWDPAYGFSDASQGIFMVCQSITRVPVERVREKLIGLLY